MTAMKQLAGNSSGDVAIGNENFAALAMSALFAKNYVTTGALVWGYYGGRILVDGVITNIADGTVALTASSTNFVEVDRAGTVSVNTTEFTAGRRPLYTVATDATGITSETDERQTNYPVTGKLSKSVAGGVDVTLTAAEARNQILEFTGALTGSINVILPAAVQEWTVFNNTSGAFTLTMDVAGTPGGVAITQGKRRRIYADGANIQVSGAEG